MKTKRVIMISLSILLLSAWSSISVFAQNNMERLVKELEEKGVDVKLVVRRNSVSKKICYRMKTFSFYSKEGNYAKELEEAFDKDSEDADEYVKDKKYNYRSIIFNDGKMLKSYNMRVSGNSSQPRVDFSVLYRDLSVPNDHRSIIFSEPWARINIDSIRNRVQFFIDAPKSKE